MNSVRFSAKPSRQRLALLIGLFAAAIVGLAAYIGMPSYLSGLPTSFGHWTGVETALAIAIAVLFVIAAAITLVRMFATYRHSGPDRNFLLLDPSGLSYARSGECRHWPWTALPAFKMVLKCRQIHFLLPKDEMGSQRRDSWIHEVTPDGPVAAIQDIYDAPIDQIAAKLNKYRDQARGRPKKP